MTTSSVGLDCKARSRTTPFRLLQKRYFDRRPSSLRYLRRRRSARSRTTSKQVTTQTLPNYIYFKASAESTRYAKVELYCPHTQRQYKTHSTHCAHVHTTRTTHTHTHTHTKHKIHSSQECTYTHTASKVRTHTNTQTQPSYPEIDFFSSIFCLRI